MMASLLPQPRHSIYALIDPRTLSEMYIGRTEDPLPDRLNSHLSSARCGEMQNTALLLWLRELLSLGLRPIIEEVVPGYGLVHVKQQEVIQIRRFAGTNPGLLNLQHNPRRRSRRPFTERYMKAVG